MIFFFMGKLFAEWLHIDITLLVATPMNNDLDPLSLSVND